MSTEELKTFRKCYSDLNLAIRSNIIPLAEKLFSVGLITSENLNDLSNTTISEVERASKLLSLVLTKITLSARNYHVFVKVLISERDTYKEILKNLEPIYKEPSDEDEQPATSGSLPAGDKGGDTRLTELDTKRNDEEPPSKKPRKSEGENEKSSMIKKISGRYNGTTYTFVEAVPEYLRCNKCRNLPVNPHRAHGLLFCELCIKRHLQSCSISNCAISEPPSKSQIEDLEIMCPNSSLKCDWVGLLREAGDHCLVCDKEKVPCTYSDIGCTDKMLREELKDHEDKDQTKHLNLAMKTITKMKKTDDTIRAEMINLQDLFRKKLEEQKTRHDKAIQHLREEISQCPPLIAKMTNHSGYPEPLSVFDLVNNSKVFTSSSFYSHPQGYKLCLVLKCCGSNPQLNDEKKDLTVKLNILALFQDQSSLSWPCKGVAIITLQPESLKSSQLSVDFDITAPPSDSSIDHIVSEPGFSVHDLPREWRNSTPCNLTLKIEKIDII